MSNDGSLKLQVETGEIVSMAVGAGLNSAFERPFRPAAADLEGTFHRPSAMNLRLLNGIGAPSPEGGYSQAVDLQAFQRLLFVSGQIPASVQGAVPEGFDAQARLVWANILAQLQAAGMTVGNLVKVTTFLSSRIHADVNGAIRREVLGDHRPALTVIVAEIFDPGWLLEIEAIAAA